MTQLVLGHGKGLILDDAPRSSKRPLSQNDMVLAIMRRSHPTAWWTPRQLRAHVLDVYGVDSEAITSRIRELRQRGYELECRKIKGAKAYEYRLKEEA